MSATIVKITPFLLGTALLVSVFILLFIVSTDERGEIKKDALVYAIEHFSETSAASYRIEKFEDMPAQKRIVQELRDIIKTAQKKEQGMLPIEPFERYYDVLGPARLINLIEEVPYCHSEGHSIGTIIFLKTRNFTESINICGNSCNVGCVHGVLIGAFKADEEVLLANIDDSLKERANELCEKDMEVARYTGIGNCYHAMGHAFMNLANYDIPLALTLCDVFKEKGIGAVYYCATGVYMERELVFTEKDALVSELYPCDVYRDHPAACYRYKVRNVVSGFNGYTHFADTCLMLDMVQRRGCFHGLGFGAWGYVDKNPESIVSLCKHGDSIDQKMCIEGAIGILSVYHRESAEQACGAFMDENNRVCENAILNSINGMNKDFSWYYYHSSGT